MEITKNNTEHYGNNSNEGKTGNGNEAQENPNAGTNDRDTETGLGNGEDVTDANDDLDENEEKVDRKQEDEVAADD